MESKKKKNKGNEWKRDSNFLANMGYRGVWEQKQLQGSNALKKKCPKNHCFRRKMIFEVCLLILPLFTMSNSLES